MTVFKRLYLSLCAAAAMAAALLPCCASASDSALEDEGMREDIASNGFPRACFAFNDDLSTLTPLDLNSMISVAGPAIERSDYPMLKVRGNEVCLNYLMFGTDYKVTFRQGMTGTGGRTLKQDRSISFTSASMMPRVAAYPVLASRKDGTISVTVSAVNLRSVRVSVAEVPRESLVGIAMQDDSGPAVGTEKASRILSRGYRLLAERVISLPPERNERTSTVLTVPAVLREGCSYLALLTDPLVSADDAIGRAVRGFKSSMWGANLFKNSPLSALASRIGDAVYVSSALDTDGSAPEGAEVALLDRRGVQLDASAFNKSGRTSIHHLSRFGDRLEGALLRVTASNAGIDIPLPDPEPPSANDPNDAGLWIDAYTDRASCMPGDTIAYAALSRDEKGRPASSGDLILDVLSPSGSAFKSMTLSNSGYGAYTASVRIPALNPGGTWTLRLRTPASDTADERRIEVSSQDLEGLSAQYDGMARRLFPGSTENISFRTLYHGNYPAYGIAASAKVTYTNDRHPFDGAYSEFKAGPDPHEKIWNASYDLGSATTGDEGVAAFQLSVPWYSYPRKAVVEARFTGQGDQAATVREMLHIAPSDNICGVRIIAAEGRSIAQAKLFSPAGKPVSGRIYYKISKLVPMPVYVHRPSGWRYEFEHVPLKLSSGQADFNASRDSSGEIQLPTGSGLHLLELATASGMRTSTTFVNGYTASKPGEQILSVKAWNAGGSDWTAQFSSPWEGRGELSVDTPFGRKTKDFTVLRGSNTVSFKAESRAGAPMRIEISAFFKANRDLMYTGRGAALAEPPDAEANYAPVIEPGERHHSLGGDTMVLRMHPKVPGVECTYMVTAVSTPYKFRNNTMLDTFSGGMLDRERARTAYSGLIHSPRGGDESVEIPLGTDDQRLDVSVLCWNEFYSGRSEKTLSITFPARVHADPIDFLNAGDVAAPEITVLNTRQTADFRITASCSGAASCHAERSIPIIGGDSASFLVPVTTRATGRASMRVRVESGGFSREIRRDFDVINPWTPMVYTELVPLTMGERRAYSSDLNFSPISRGSISCGPMPYANRTVLTSALLSRSFAALSDNLVAALGLVNANRFMPGNETSAQIQSRIDGIAAMVRPDGTLREGGITPRYASFQTIAASMLMHRAAMQSYSVGSGILDELDRRCEHIEVAERDSALQALLLYARTIAGHPLPPEAATARAIELLNAPDMTSPAAISLLACVCHEAGDDDNASLAISLAITRVRRILSLMDLFGNENDSRAFPRLYELMDCASFPSSTPQMNAAFVLYAVATTGLNSFMDQALSLFRNDGFFSSSRAAVDAILLTLSRFQEGRATESAFPDNWSKVTLQNRTQGPLYCTAAAYGYDLDQALSPENSDLRASVSVHNRDSLLAMPRNSVRLNEDFVLAIDVRSKKLSSSMYKITIPLVPGMKFERVLKGLDPHYMKLGPLSLVVGASASEREVTLLASCRSGVNSRIAILMRPRIRGRFTMPAVEVAEQHGVLKPVYWADSGTLTVD